MTNRARITLPTPPEGAAKQTRPEDQTAEAPLAFELRVTPRPAPERQAETLDSPEPSSEPLPKAAEPPLIDNVKPAPEPSLPLPSAFKPEIPPSPRPAPSAHPSLGGVHPQPRAEAVSAKTNSDVAPGTEPAAIKSTAAPKPERDVPGVASVKPVNPATPVASVMQPSSGPPASVPDLQSASPLPAFRPDTAHAATVKPELPGPAPIPEDVPKAASPARDMHIALDNGEQRVDVRIADRSGSLHVAVRTPDDRLASSLRADLPALTARLESAGLHPESWRPAAASSTRDRDVPTLRPGAQQSQEQPSQQQRKQQEEPSPQKNAQGDSKTKRNRKDFQWQFTSLQ